MELRKEQVYTAEDYWNLPEGRRAELLDGKLYDRMPPSRMHQELVYQIGRVIGNYIADSKGGCKVYPAPFAVNLQADDRTWVEPDISVICDPEKLSDRGCEGAPDWIIEVASPGTARMDYSVKLFKYRMAGVREYWIVNPMKRTVQTYTFENGDDGNQYSFEDAIPVKIYEDLEITVDVLL